METKTYYAKDLSEVMDNIKQELGDDAIIIKSRRTKQGGLMGLFKSAVYEVVVSYEPESKKRPPETKESQQSGNPLSDFGRAVTVSAITAATAEKQRAIAKSQAAKSAASKTNPDAPITLNPRFFDKGKSDEYLPPLETNDFAELIRMAGAISAQEVSADFVQPAWITPDAKLNAYASMSKSPKAGVEAERRGKAEFVPGGEFINRPAEKPAAKAEALPNVNIPAKRGRGRPRKTEPQTASSAAAANRNGEEISMRLDAVESMLRELMTDIRAGGVKDKPPKEQESNDDLTLEAKRLCDCLKRQDVDEQVAEELVESALELSRAYGLTLQAATERAIRKVLGKPRYIRGSTKTARTVMLVGPTGVGKTTTLVKLAAGCIFERKAKVAIINADIFRVGAQDQLKAYAKILDVPIKTIYETDELKTALSEFSSYDFIFIDTCGKASTDKTYQSEIRELLNTGRILDTYLVVSSTTSGRLCRQIVESYAFMNEYKTILTKVDESGTVGGAVNLAFYSGQPLSYVTIGQNVPDDITKIDVDGVINQLLREL